MEAIRKIVNREQIKILNIPESFGQQVEIIIIPANSSELKDSEVKLNIEKEFYKAQAENGFSLNVLEQQSEDVWNEL